MNLTPTANGQLFVWTDIDPAHEADFNAWYDREHMEERVAIPGMLWARRYRAHDDAARRYLAIYRTESLGTFTSDAYRAAFTRQTDWSNRNFARMDNTQRRVMAVSAEAGFGAGCAVALAELGDATAGDEAAAARASDLAAALASRPEVLRVQLLAPDPALSTPLPSEAGSERVMRRVLMADTLTRAAAAELAAELPALAGGDLHGAGAFDLIWSLDHADLSARRGDTRA
ncbi:DUF4286 family protein [Paracoccus sanguinis]|uniref:Uncharacterized protein n=1 Tax=Paracoccus sanguinis TaxID=1545044 RepID=A0A1H2X1B5_9RHOB|nr:DUF4286 family protein [Paracoccus sanguinis]KGJ14620.1 hypothetical protein IX57_15800 [Paracoccus sanguinis]SDW86670.1 hypothetical protein SAMN05444276_102345 [Paracoccus sanguinis]